MPIASGQRDREAPTRHHADAGVGVGEAGAVGRDQKVAGERELEAPRHGGAVDRADDRLAVRRKRARHR